MGGVAMRVLKSSISSMVRFLEIMVECGHHFLRYTHIVSRRSLARRFAELWRERRPCSNSNRTLYFRAINSIDDILKEDRVLSQTELDIFELLTIDDILKF
uniref:Uncharacterized protein n=1 Tax=Cacopsylla melanoneura TaxID=428564 RepID=A0A8D8VSI0_9HEMI